MANTARDSYFEDLDVNLDGEDAASTDGNGNGNGSTNELRQMYRAGAGLGSNPIAPSGQQANVDPDIILNMDDDLISQFGPTPDSAETVLLMRNDHFIHCLVSACGTSSMTISSCFHKVPDEDEARNMSTYLPYLVPFVRTALVRTDMVIQQVSGRRLTLERCIAQEYSDIVLFVVVSEALGQFMRKHVMDNVLKSSHSRMNSLDQMNGLNIALKNLINEIKARIRTTSSDSGAMTRTGYTKIEGAPRIPFSIGRSF
jgi:hypothetical protein